MRRMNTILGSKENNLKIDVNTQPEYIPDIDEDCVLLPNDSRTVITISDPKFFTEVEGSNYITLVPGRNSMVRVVVKFGDKYQELKDADMPVIGVEVSSPFNSGGTVVGDQIKVCDDKYHTWIIKTDANGDVEVINYSSDKKREINLYEFLGHLEFTAAQQELGQVDSELWNVFLDIDNNNYYKITQRGPYAKDFEQYFPCRNMEDDTWRIISFKCESRASAIFYLSFQYNKRTGQISVKGND